MHSKRMLMGLTIAAVTAGCGVLPAAPGTRDEDNPPSYVNVTRTDAIHIQLVPQAADGAPRNQHPAAFQPAQIETLLTSLRLRSPEGQVTTFTSTSRMKNLAADLSKAFVRAGSRQDVAFVVFRQVASGPLFGSSKRVTSGRMFYRDNTLNIIFGAFDADVNPFANLKIADFDYGSRGQAGSASTRQLAETGTWHFHADRRDWIEMPATREAIAAARNAAPEVIESSSGQAATSFDYGPAASGARSGNATSEAPVSAQTAAPQVTPENGPAASVPVSTQPETSAVPAIPAAKSPSQQDAGWSRIEERLTQLKRLRDKGLISADDYQNKKDALLEQLP